MRKQNSCGDTNELVTNFPFILDMVKKKKDALNKTSHIDYMEDFPHKKTTKKRNKGERGFCIVVGLFVFFCFFCFVVFHI